MFRIAIVEDEEESIRKLTAYISRFEEKSGTEIIQKVFRNGMDFISDYDGKFDIVFMDIEMPYVNGLEAARRLREVDEEVCLIFVTNLARYAIEGYAVRALDFLVKPVEYQNFSIKLQNAIELRNRVQKKELVLTTASGIQRIRLNEIYYVEVIDHNLIYHTARGDFEERYSMASREEQFAPYDFARASKSFLVNLRYVDAVRGNDVLVNEVCLPIGRTKKKEFMQKLTEYLGDCIQ